MNIKEENGFYSITNRVIAEVVKKEDDYIKQKILDWAKQHSEEIGEDIEVLFLDEDKARIIINLGVEEYLRRENLLEREEEDE